MIWSNFLEVAKFDFRENTPSYHRWETEIGQKQTSHSKESQQKDQFYSKSGRYAEQYGVSLKIKNSIFMGAHRDHGTSNS
jgi:hypothetical protein